MTDLTVYVRVEVQLAEGICYQPVFVGGKMFFLGRIFYFIFSVIVFFIAFRLIFLFFGISDGNPFISLVMTWGGFFAGPFLGVLPPIDLPAPLGFIETGSLLALAVYVIVGQLFAGLF